MASQLLDQPRTRFVLRCWGDFAMADAEGVDVRPRGRKSRALLAYLTMHPDKPVGRERLMALLWSDRADEQARGSLRQTLFELKPFGNGEGLVAVERDSVTLNSAALETDIDGLRALARSERYEELLAALPDQDECLFASLDGLSAGWDEWLQIERSRQQDMLQALIADAAAAAAAAGHGRAARALNGRLAPGGNADVKGPPEPMQSAAAPTPVAAATQAAPALTSSRRSFVKVAVAGSIVTVGASASIWLAAWRDPADRLHREAETLTDSARAMLRGRDDATVRAARDLLRRAVALAPDYAPAWAALATATAVGQPTPQQRAQAEAHARNAIRLDPQLADGHAALGMVLGFAGAEAGAHLKRAAALNPRDAQTQYWLSHHYGSELSFHQSLVALRSSVASDPLWARGVNDAALFAWQMGHGDEARRYAQRLTQLDPQQAFACEYQLDLASGEFAAIAQRMIRSRARFDRPEQGDRKLGATLLILGHTGPARLLMRLEPYQWEIASGAAPSAEAFARVDAGATHDGFDSSHFLALALQRLLHGGRGEEIVAAYDRGGSGQLPQLAGADTSRLTFVHYGPELGLALKAVGRAADAIQLLDRTERIVREAYAQGPVPIPFNVCAARMWAAQGDHARALALLTHAVDRGFHYAPLTPMPDIGTIFAFRELRGTPGFESVRMRLRRHLERERDKLGPVQI